MTLQPADQGDTQTIQETLAETAGNLAHLIEREAEKASGEEPQLSGEPLAEIVCDKGYHSNDTVLKVQRAPARSYIPEPKLPAPQLGGEGGGLAEGRVCEPAQSPRQLRKTAAEETRGTDREVIRALLRNRRYADASTSEATKMF